MGWPPVPVTGKFPPESGRTGANGTNLTHTEIEARVKAPNDGRNLAWRMPKSVIGVDVDAHDNKSGAATLAAAEAECGALPDTIRTSARGFGASGIRYFRLPQGVEATSLLENWLSSLGGGIEIVRRDHRYAVTVGSIHPATGQEYRLYGPDGSELSEIPQAGKLPLLPDAWAAKFAKAEASAPVLDDPLAIKPNILDRRPVPIGQQNGDMLNYAASLRRNWLDGDEIAACLWLRVKTCYSEQDASKPWTFEDCARMAERTCRKIAKGDGSNRTIDGLDQEDLPEVPNPWALGTWDDVMSADYADVLPELAPVYEFGKAGALTFSLIYPGQVHSLAAPSNIGKSWFAYAEMARLARDGKRALFLDYETNRRRALARLRTFGLTDEQVRHIDYVRPSTCLLNRSAMPFWDDLKSRGYALVILDGVTNALTIGGIDPNVAKEISPFMEHLRKFAVDSGAAVFMIDHLPKVTDGATQANGSFAKLAQVDVQYLAKRSSMPLRRGEKGYFELSLSKDRDGFIQEHMPGTTLPGAIARFELDSTMETSRATLWAMGDGEDDTDDRDQRRHTFAIAYVCEVLDRCSNEGRLSRRNIWDLGTAIRRDDPHFRALRKTEVMDAIDRECEARGGRLIDYGRGARGGIARTRG